MKKAIYSFALIAVLALFASCPGSSSSNRVNVLGQPSTVCVAWAENDAGGIKQTYVKCKRLATGWIQLGGSLNVDSMTSTGSLPSVAMDLNGLPYVAWEEAGKIYVKHFNLATLKWDLVGVEVDGSGTVLSPKLSVGADGAVVVSYLKDDTPFNLYARRWDGAAWQLMGPGSLNIDIAQGVNSNSLSVLNAALAYVAWYESNGLYNEIYVKQWNGSSWTQLPAGQSLNIAANSAWFPVIAADNNGTPYVTFRQGSDVYSVYWDAIGSAWITMGGGPVSGGSSILSPLLAIGPSGTPYLTWDESYLYYAARWDGATWQAMGPGTLSIPGSGNYTTGMTVSRPVYPSSSIEMPMLYWVGSPPASPYNVTTMYWDGVAWQTGENLNINPAINVQPIGSISSR